jgi:hypothetical protein
MEAPVPCADPVDDRRRACAIRIALLIGAAVAVAVTYRQLNPPAITYDASGYLHVSRQLAAGQTDGWGLRTYGYPAFLVPWDALAGGDQRVLLWIVFAVQLAIHLVAAWLFARRVAGAFGDDRLGRLTLVLVALNPFLLRQTARLVTDSLSAALIAVAAGLLLPRRAERGSAGAVCRDGVLALLVLALAAEVRPVNAILLPVGGLIWAVRWWAVARRDARRLLGGLLLVGGVAVLPLIPQMLANWREYGQPHPLVVGSLYAQQAEWGLQNLKYTTVSSPRYRVDPAGFYRNPFWAGETSFVEFARANPLGFVATLALHAFAMFDYDRAFSHAPELGDPWYRWPLSGLGHLFMLGATVGLVLGWRRPGAHPACAVLSALALAHLLVYLPVVIESRHGLPFFSVLAPFVGMTLLAVHGWVQARAWRQVAWVVLVALLVVGAGACLSIWMQAQAPTLVMLREFFRAPGPEVPVAAFEVAPPERWTLEQRQTYVVRATNLGERRWYAAEPAQIFLHIMFVGPGDVETVDSRVELRLLIDREVPPGGQLEMEVRVTAPRKEGSYRLRHQLELDAPLGLAGGASHDTPVTVDVRRSRR